MSESTALPNACPKCDAALPADAAEGLCPRCLMAEAMLPTGPKKAWEPPTAAELGELLPEYDIEKLLGRGGMGAVYKGRQKSLDRPVAIKILSSTLDESDQGFAERFKNEARALGKLKHPGIVGVYDFGTAADGLLYIVMEFIDGTDVAKMIAKSGRLHTDHAMAITAHVCDALAYAHERGIIHRDIKPANIMVGYDGNVKVADFGLAKMTHGAESGLTQSGMAMGTLHYMAPECLTLGTAVDHRADIYAVGVMLYQMLTGKLPKGMFKLPSLQIKGLDPRYDGIIAKALREEREARYQTILEMRVDLDGILTQPVLKMESSSDSAMAVGDEASHEETEDEAIWPTEPESKSSPLLSLLAWLVVLGAAFALWMLLKPPTKDTSSSPPALAGTKAPVDTDVVPTHKSPPSEYTMPAPSPVSSPPTKPVATLAAPSQPPVVPAKPKLPPPAVIEIIQVPPAEPASLDDSSALAAVGKAAQIRAVVSKVEPLDAAGGCRIFLKGASLTLACSSKAQRAVFQNDNPLQAITPGQIIVAHGPVQLVGTRPELVLTRGHQWTPHSPDYLPASLLDQPARVFANASLCALDHGKEPVSSRDESITPFILERQQGALEFVQHDFPGPKVVEGCEVYWYLSDGPMRLPRFWKVLYLDEAGFWLPVSAGPEAAKADQWNVLRFNPVRTRSLRLVMQPPWACKVGFHDWKILPSAESAPKAAPATAELWLDDLLPLRRRGPGRNDRSYMVSTFSWWQEQRGARVLLDGEPCTRYLSTGAPFSVTYAVPPGYSRFRSVAIGPQGGAGITPSWSYQIQADDKVVFQSNALDTYAEKKIDVDVALPPGTQTLTLITHTNGVWGAEHAIWALPRLLRDVDAP